MRQEREPSVRRFFAGNSNLKSRRRVGRAATLSLAAAAALPAVASATTYQWVGGTGNWGTAANTSWSPTGLPNNSDTANVTNTLGLTQTITYNYTGTDLTLNTLTVDALGTGTPLETLSLPNADALRSNTGASIANANRPMLKPNEA